MLKKDSSVVNFKISDYVKLMYHARIEGDMSEKKSSVVLINIGCFLKRFSINVTKNARKNEDDVAGR